VPLEFNDLPESMPDLSEATLVERQPPTGAPTERSSGWDSMLDLLAAGELDPPRQRVLCTWDWRYLFSKTISQYRWMEK
jgi:hypothetical protein